MRAGPASMRSGPGGRGAASGHFGEVLQGRFGVDGPVGLVTTPWPSVRAEARFYPARRASLRVRAPIGLEQLARRGARAALRMAWRLDLGGCLDVSCAAPPGGGAGASTMVVLASIRAVCAAIGCSLSPKRTAALCLAVEGASDPLMFDRPGALLWASRRGEILRRLPDALSLEIVGLFDGPGRATDPGCSGFADVLDLIEPLAAARLAHDHSAIGALAEESARRNGVDRILPHFEAVAYIGRRHRAHGVLAAHTGSALGLVFTPKAPGAQRARSEMAALGLGRPYRFLSCG